MGGSFAEPLLASLQHEFRCAPLQYAEAPTPVTGGFSTEIYRFRLAGAPPEFSVPLVLRLGYDELPDEEVMREALIQDAVARDGRVPAPPVFARGRVGARSFLVSPLAPGRPFDDTLGPTTAIGAFRRMAGQIATTMATLHRVPVDPVLGELGVAGWPASRLDSLAVLGDVEEHAVELDNRDLKAHAAVLRACLPRFADPVVCHGDLHSFNLLYEGDRVSAVLDWEVARIADPAYDVARSALLLWAAPYPMPKLARAAVQPVAGRLARSFVAAYRKQLPVDEESLRWHEALHILRTLTLSVLGERRPAPPRLRRLAEVWTPVAPRLVQRLQALTAEFATG